MPEVTGIDHIYITVSDIERAKKFYDPVMGILGFRKNMFMLNNEEHVQYYNQYFGYVIRPALENIKHNAHTPGIHHLCFRVEGNNDIKIIFNLFKEQGIEVTEPELYTEYAPDYYAIYLNDPDGIQLEITNYRQERRERYDNWN